MTITDSPAAGVCPFCGCIDVDDKWPQPPRLSDDYDEIRVPAGCHECGAKWVQVFTLSHVEPDKQPTEDDGGDDAKTIQAVRSDPFCETYGHKFTEVASPTDPAHFYLRCQCGAVRGGPGDGADGRGAGDAGRR